MPRYVLPCHFQTSSDDKNGYHHVLLHSLSRTYLALNGMVYILNFFALSRLAGRRVPLSIYTWVCSLLVQFARWVFPYRGILMIVMLASFSVHLLAPVWFQARSSPKLLLILCVFCLQRRVILLVLQSCSRLRPRLFALLVSCAILPTTYPATR